MRTPGACGLFLLAILWASAEGRADDWKPLFQGIDYMRLERDQPRPIKANALRIDLRAEGIEVLTTPSNGEAPGETDGLRTSSFLKRMRCQVAVNASPFSPIHFREGRPQDVSGLAISEGSIVSPADNAFPVLSVRGDNRVRISDRLPKTDGIRSAVAGFGIVLRKGVVSGAEKPLHPRTAAAVSKDGRYLYLLVVDGRQKGYSEGASTREIGVMLKELGGWDGVNLDGGGTTTMVVEGKGGKPGVINRPIHGGIPGLERVSASHLGIRARPLEKAR